MLAEVDAAIGVLLSGLYARGLADTVSVVIASDHGQWPRQVQTQRQTADKAMS